MSSNNSLIQSERQQLPKSISAIETSGLWNQVQHLEAEKRSLYDVIERLKEEVARTKVAVSERDAKNKKLQRVIIENSQNITPPMDEDVVNLFNTLSHDIMTTVKRHFQQPFEAKESEMNVWRSYRVLSAENKELWVRGQIASRLYTAFFKNQKLFGLDAKREDMMRDFEMDLERSGRGWSISFRFIRLT